MSLQTFKKWPFRAKKIALLATQGVALLCQGIVLASILPLQESLSRAVAVGAILWAVVEIVFILWATPERLAALPKPPARWQQGYLLFAAAFSFVLGLIPAHPLTQAPAILNAALTLILLHRVLFDVDTPIQRPRVWLTVIGIGTLIVSLVRAYALSVYPFIDWNDEPWTLSWALSYLRTGHFSDILMHGLGDAYVAFPRFYVPFAWWLGIVGVGLWEGRLYTLLLTFPLIAFSALAARNLYGKQTGWLTAFVLLASVIVVTAMRIRHDIGLAICTAASLWLYSEALRQPARRYLHLIAGIVMGLGMFSHYHAAGLGVALLLGLYLPRYVTQFRQGRRLPEAGLWLYGIGGLIGGGAVLLLQMIPDGLVEWYNQLQDLRNYSTAAEIGIATLSHPLMIAKLSVLELALIVMGAVNAAIRRRPADWAMLAVILFGILALGIMAKAAIYYYTLPLVPFFALLIASLLVGPQKQPEVSTSPWRKGQAVTAVVMILPLLGTTLYTPIQHVLSGGPMHLPTPPEAQWVLDHVEQDQVIVGDARYYLWLHEYPFTAHLLAGYLEPENRERYGVGPALWEAVDFDVLIYASGPGFTSSTDVFRPLVEGDFLQTHGYVAAADFSTDTNTIIVYIRLAASAANTSQQAARA
jgi:4-amino-4-deoxy-L-arabinose transferase-like glycosyltransferase